MATVSTFLSAYQAATFRAKIEALKAKHATNVPVPVLPSTVIPIKNILTATEMDTSKKPAIIKKSHSDMRGDTLIIDGDTATSDDEIRIARPLKTVTLRGLTDKRVYLGPCAGSLHLEGCHRMELTGAAQQVRLDRCSDVSMNVWVGTAISLTECTDISTIPESNSWSWYDEFEAHKAEYGPRGTQNNSSNILDFSSLY